MPIAGGVAPSFTAFGTLRLYVNTVRSGARHKQIVRRLEPALRCADQQLPMWVGGWVRW